jgi:hypothetical protein
VVAAYLFGSQARGTAGPRSDVDLGVLFRDPPPAGLESFRLESELELALRRPVQVVILNRAPADLVHRVLRDGQLRHRLTDRLDVDRYDLSGLAHHGDIDVLLRAHGDRGFGTKAVENR